MSDDLPAFEPLMLSGLTYSELVEQMKTTGCAGRRDHWCLPIVRWDCGQVVIDDEGEVEPFLVAIADRGASDWSMTANPARAA